MCLLTKTLIPKIAKHDIICYKVLRKSTMKSFFTEFSYRMNTTYKGDLKKCLKKVLKEAGNYCYKSIFKQIIRAITVSITYKCSFIAILKTYIDGNLVFSLSDGFYHSYQTLDDVIKDLPYYHNLIIGETIKNIANGCGNGEFYDRLVKKSFETVDSID